MKSKVRSVVCLVPVLFVLVTGCKSYESKRKLVRSVWTAYSIEHNGYEKIGEYSGNVVNFYEDGTCVMPWRSERILLEAPTHNWEYVETRGDSIVVDISGDTPFAGRSVLIVGLGSSGSRILVMVCDTLYMEASGLTFF